MDGDYIYASDDRSSLELIEQEFAMSRSRSLQRRRVLRTSRLVRAEHVLPAIAVIVVAVFLLGLMQSVFPIF